MGYDQILGFTPKFRRERGANLGKYWNNVKIIGFLNIFWDILNKMKDNLVKMCKTGLLSFQGKIGTIAPDFPEKNDSFPVLTLLF